MAKKEKRKFNYVAPTTEHAKKRAAERGGSYDSYISGDVQVFKPAEGKNKIRILPIPGSVDFDIRAYVHYGIGPDEAAYLCLKKMKEEDCPICDAKSSARDEDELKALKTSERHVAWLIDRNDEEAGPKLWAMPHQLWNTIWDISKDEDTGEVLLTNSPEEGYDIAFSIVGTGQRRKYEGTKLGRNPCPVSDDDDDVERWLEFVSENPLEDTLKFYAADYIEAVFKGKSKKDKDEDEDEEDDEDDDRRSRKASSKKPSKKSKSKKDDEDDEDQDEEEDEEKKPSKKSKSKKDDEDDEDDEDEEDEDEDEDDSSTRAKKSINKLKDRKRRR